MIVIEDMFNAIGNECEDDIFSFAQPVRQQVEINVTDNEKSFVLDVYRKTSDGRCISTKQAFVVERILAKNKQPLCELLNLPEQAIDEALKNPVYKNPPYKSIETPSEVRYIGERKLAFRSKYSPQVKDRIKSLKSKYSSIIDSEYPYFNREHNMWVVDVKNDNLTRIFSVISNLGFKFDDATLEFVTNCENARGQISNAVVYEDDIIIETNDDEVLTRWVERLKEEEDIDARYYSDTEEA